MITLKKHNSNSNYVQRSHYLQQLTPTTQLLVLIPLLHPRATTLRRQLKARLKPPTTPIISMPPQRILPREKPPTELTLMISLLLMHTQMMP